MVNIPKPYIYASAIATTVGVVYIVKDRIGGLPYQGKEDLTDKIFIVTGATSGIGKEVAEALAQRKAQVIMACRDIKKCEEIRKDIVFSSLNKFVYCRKCDLASQNSIRKFAEKFKKEFSRLDVLINNAGVMRCPKLYTKEGIEMQLGVNHIGHFLLTNLLLDVLKASAPSRIINVSSTAHYRGKLKVDDLNSDKLYNGADAYNQSKLANCLFTRELAKKLNGTNVTVNAIHPGIASTEITRHMSFHKSYFSSFILKPFIYPFTKTAKQAASSVLHLALNPDLEKVTRKYFSGMEQMEMSDIAKNDNLAQWLWITSEKWTKLNI